MIIGQVKKRGTHSGRQEISKEKDKKKIRIILENDRNLTAKDVYKDSKLNIHSVSLSTIERMINSFGLHHHRIKRKGMNITVSNKKKRFEWALKF